jgi:hypothetical protein
MTPEPKAPVRLADSPGPAGDCLRQVLAQQDYGQALPRFVTLRDQRVRRARRQQSALLALLASTALFAAWTFRPEERPPSIRAEVTRESRAPANPSQASTLPAEPRLAEAALATPKALKPVRPKTAAVRPNSRLAPGDPPRVEAARATEPEVKGGAKACAQLAREGAAEQALTCYEKLAVGGGITAELALFEQARLEGKLLRRPERALQRLDNYRRRFPSGSLRAEVMLAQIDWLVTTGDTAGALGIVDEALGSGLLRERSVELERVRDRLRGAPP